MNVECPRNILNLMLEITRIWNIEKNWSDKTRKWTLTTCDEKLAYLTPRVHYLTHTTHSGGLGWGWWWRWCEVQIKWKNGKCSVSVNDDITPTRHCKIFSLVASPSAEEKTRSKVGWLSRRGNPESRSWWVWYVSQALLGWTLQLSHSQVVCADTVLSLSWYNADAMLALCW